MHPTGRGPGGVEVRYTARDALVLAFVRLATAQSDRPVEPSAGGPTSVLLHEVHATAASSVAMLDGRRLHAEPTPEGLRVELVAPLSTDRPTVLALRDVEAR